MVESQTASSRENGTLVEGNVTYYNYECHLYNSGDRSVALSKLCNDVTADSFAGPGYTNWSKV